MKSIRAKLARIAAAVVASLLLAGNAAATPVTVVDYSGNGAPGVSLEITSAGVFQTLGGAALSSFLNWAGFIPATDAVGKIRITNVQLVGSASSLGGGTYSQSTLGGSIEFFDSADNALLTVSFSDGVILLAATGTGGQFTSNIATFSGSLASSLVPNTATHSVSLINWNPVTVVDNINGVQSIARSQRIAQSSGFGNGLVGGEPVPEPATMLLLGSGLVGALAARRRAA